MRDQALVSCRAFLSVLALAGGGSIGTSWPLHRVFAQGSAPAVVTSDVQRPAIPYGVASGDVTSTAAIIWSRTDRPSRIIVEYATTDSFKNSKRVVGPSALAIGDFTVRVDLTELSPGHYAAANYDDPANAQFTDFTPFWEFAAGPLHAGTFGPNTLDKTFGPEVKFLSIPEGLRANRPPSEGLQFFGQVKIDGKSDVMTVSFHNLQGAKIYGVELPPET
jgi:phosphodiesterase/alkaline phosphatase D-like protein